MYCSHNTVFAHVNSLVGINLMWLILDVQYYAAQIKGRFFIGTWWRYECKFDKNSGELDISYFFTVEMSNTTSHSWIFLFLIDRYEMHNKYVHICNLCNFHYDRNLASQHEWYCFMVFKWLFLLMFIVLYLHFREASRPMSYLQNSKLVSVKIGVKIVCQLWMCVVKVTDRFTYHDLL